MTVVIGIMCEDGIVIACDSQVEFNRGAPVKRLNANKIYRLKGDIAIAGAGMISFIQKAIDGIKAQYDKLVEKGGLSIETLVNGTEDIAGAEMVMASIHKRYDIERVEYLYGPGAEKGVEVVDMFLMMGGIEKEKEGLKKHLYLLHKDGVSEPVDDYATIGSGAAYAEYLLGKYYTPDIAIEVGKKLAVYVIKEVENMDPNVGGAVKVVALDEKGYNELDEDETFAIYEKIRGRDEVINELRILSLADKLKTEELKTLLSEAKGHG